MHDPYFDNRLSPNPLQLPRSAFARVVGVLLLSAEALAPLAFIAGLVSAIGAPNV